MTRAECSAYCALTTAAKQTPRPSSGASRGSERCPKAGFLCAANKISVSRETAEGGGTPAILKRPKGEFCREKQVSEYLPLSEDVRS